jgi:hypothetical protein
MPVSTEHPELRYELAEDFIADPTAPDPVTSIRPVPPRSATRETGSSAAVAPVYRRGADGDLVVPTGRVLVRFDDKDDASDHEDDLKTAGYVVDQVLPYATNTAWVRTADRNITEALHGIDRLRKLPGIVALEPEMIGTSTKRA